MRALSFMLFFSIVLLIYFSVNWLIYVRGLQAFSLTTEWRRGYLLLFWTVVSCFVVGEILEHTRSSVVSEWIYRVGAFWLAYMLYLTLSILVIDLVRLADYFFHFLPEMTPVLRFKIGVSVLSMVTVIVLFGHWNALHTRIKKLELTLPGKVQGGNPMRVVMASDLHFGALIGENREERLVRMINEQHPDLVLFCGDLVDGDIASALRKNVGKHLQEIKSPMGVYAISGNHEYIGGIQRTIPYLESLKIKILRDQTTVLPNGVQLVGRDDRDNRRMGEVARKSLKELMVGLNPAQPTIVMNHQPFHLEEAEAEGVGLHLSGHTHHGQLWPFNYLTKAIFELSWGYLKKGNTHFYVSSGFGSWGPPVRIGNTPEIVVFDLHFEEPKTAGQ